MTPVNPQSLDELIGRKAIEFADQIKAAAAMADKEEEIRIETEKQLAFIQREAGIKLEGKHEFTVASGRIDSVYDRVIIEYKNPSSPGTRIGSRSDTPGAKKVVKQIQNRFRDMKKEHGHGLNSLLGVGLDGNNFIFVRFRDDKWQIQEPVEVNKYSAERFLWALFNLGIKGKPFSQEYLSGDFGSEARLTRDGIRTLYNAISETANPKAQTFFKQWKILFGEVCGYNVDNPSEKIAKLSDFYGIPRKNIKPAEMLFSVHTYYAIFMKLLASEIVAFFHRLPTPLARIMQAPTSAKLKREMEDLETGSIFRHFNITNFLEGDLFAWYTSVWSEEIEKLIRDMAAKLDNYNPGTLSENPLGSRDLLKKLYQNLFPKSVRHDMGEYYTPDWLAEHLLTEIGYDGNPDTRLLDPACGSGTFLVMAINRVRKWFDENRERCNFPEGELQKKILTNIVGFDLNPLAVMAARTNYLIAIRDIVGRIDKIEIPVYLCDSIMTPSEYGDIFTGKTGNARKLDTAAGHFLIPSEIAQNRADVATYADQLEFCIKNSYTTDEFLDRCREEGLEIKSEQLHTKLYDQLVSLDKANKNGVWARIIKNAFAPLFIEKVDMVIGNPPWVVWDNLPEEYRNSTKHLWERYGLFSLSGRAATHGGGKKDISMLMLYVSADRYLKDDGKLGFVITQTLFQTKGAGDGFRRFRLGQNGADLKVLGADDMVQFQPFEGASNWTGLIFLSKGQKTEWPIPYTKWSLIGEMPTSETEDWSDRFQKDEYEALPIDIHKTNSPWIIKPKGLKTELRDLVNDSDYKAHLGANTGGANGVFWVRILKITPGGVLIANVAEKSKIQIDSVTKTIEPDLLYPLIRWSDISRYKASPSYYLILAQDVKERRGIDEHLMRKKYPKTYDYLNQFKGPLLKRAAYKRYQGDAPFYSMYDIDEYTIGTHKVIWRRMDKRINAAVVTDIEDEFLGRRPVVPQETCVLIETDSAAEAHYLCAVLNSLVVNYIVKAHSVRGGKGFGTPSMMDYVGIRQFHEDNATHKALVGFSKAAHKIAAKYGDLTDIQNEIDEIAASLWDIKKSEFTKIKLSFESET